MLRVEQNIVVSCSDKLYGHLGIKVFNECITMTLSLRDSIGSDFRSCPKKKFHLQRSTIHTI